ncbi:MAG: hypothetical protein EOP88_00290 [Verrucomicrobiaceae bacterium]|nr:MAG: hypothetical protein EOP88_00290 [Verrucomicrobiaceae bacterium]
MKQQSKAMLSGILFAAVSTGAANAEYFTDKSPAAGAQPGSLYVPVSAPSGTTASLSEGWEELTATAYPDNDVTFPGTGTWPAALESLVGDDAGSNGLLKTTNGFAGGPYPASGSELAVGLSNDADRGQSIASVISRWREYDKDAAERYIMDHFGGAGSDH